MHRRYLAALLVLSGFCGLAYELIWVRMLSLSFGSTTLSFSTVIAVFLGGLALGSWLCGRSKRALANPVRTYAVLEIATGVIGLALFPVLRALPEVFSYIDPGVGAGGLLARLAVSILVLLPPTLLMGATLPVACAACIHDDAKLGSGTAILYGLNTLGACFGTYGVTFVLFPSVGLSGALAVTAALNFVVGFAAWGASRAHLDERTTSADRPAALGDATAGVWSFPALLSFLTGFAAVAAQVTWSRIFSSFLSGTIYGVGAVLVAVLVGIAAGSLLLSRSLVSARGAARTFVVLQVVLLASLLLFWWGLPWIQYQIQTLEFGLTGRTLIHAQLGLVIIALFVPAASSGATLPVLVRVVESSARGIPQTLSRMYAANTIGSVLGSLATGFVLLPVLGTAATAYLATLLVGATAAVAAVRWLREAGIARLAPAALAVAGVAVFPEIDPIRTVTPATRGQSFWAFQAEGRQAVANTELFIEGKAASVHVTRLGPSRNLTLNGLAQGGYSTTAPRHLLESLLVAQIPMMHASRHDSALVIGLGAGSTVDAMLQFGVQHVRVLELERGVADAQRVIFRGPAPIESSRVEVVIDDARHHLLLNRRTTQRFDVITSMPAHPWISASVFTREFFEVAHDNLERTGVFTMWFGRSRLDDEIFLGLLHAFEAVFEHYVIYDIPEVGALYFVGSPSPIEVDTARFGRLAALPIVGVHGPNAQDLAFFARRVLGGGKSNRVARSPINTDLTMMAEVRGPLVGSSTLTLSALLDHPGLDPTMITGPQRQETIERALDQLVQSLRSPAQRPKPVVVAAASRASAFLRSVSSALDTESVVFFDAQIRLLSGEAAAVVQLEQIVRDHGRYARPAQSLLATRSNREAPTAAANGVTESHTWLSALSGDLRAAAIARARSSTATAIQDPTGWLVAGLAGPWPVPTPMRGDFVRAIAAGLDTEGERFADLCVQSADAVGVPRLIPFCEEAARGHQRRATQSILSDAAAAGRAGKYTEALERFAAAGANAALDVPTLELYLKTAVRVGDAAAVDNARDGLRMRRLPDALIGAREEEARAAVDEPRSLP